MKTWTFEDTVMLLRMDGLLAREQQTKYLKRVTTRTQIHDFWKRYPRHNEGLTNGMPLLWAKHFAPHCPYIYTEARGGLKLCLWVDILETVSPTVPPEIRASLATMMRYQAWVHGITTDRIRETVWEIITRTYQPLAPPSRCRSMKKLSSKSLTRGPS